VQVCTLDRCCEHQRTHLLHARYRMCICAIYIHVYIHICMCRCVCMHVYIFICMYAFTCICVCAWMYIYVYVYVHMYVCIYICICMCVYIYMYLYITCMCSLFHLALGNEDGGVQPDTHTSPPAPMNHIKYLMAGPAEMPFQNWYTANTNHFCRTDFCQAELTTQMG